MKITVLSLLMVLAVSSVFAQGAPRGGMNDDPVASNPALITAKLPRTIANFWALNKELNLQQVKKVFGEPDSVTGTDPQVIGYLLDDGSQISIAFSAPDQPLLFIKHLRSDGNVGIIYQR